MTDLVFELNRIAEQQPSAMALSDGSTQLTYKELMAQAAAVANYIHKVLRVEGAVIALCAKPSVAAIVTLLGIMFSRNGYLPLSPDSPAALWEEMCQQAKAQLIFADEDCLTKCLEYGLSSQLLPKDLPLDSGNCGLLTSGKTNLAYIIYTSGTTGKPKGVIITCANLESMLACIADTLNPPIKRLLLSFPLEFDGFLASLFWTLWCGGTLFIIDHWYKLNMEFLGAMIHKDQITHLLCLPSYYRRIIQHIPSHQLSSLQSVILAGEMCHADIINSHYSKLSSALFNAYGTTETTIWNAIYHCKNQPYPHGVPIGKPIANSEFYLVDSAGNFLTHDGQGELYISGKCISQGYIELEQLSHAFIYHTEQDKFFYRTGDIAYIKDGEYIIVGRKQDFLKIAGYRLNLEYIKDIFYQSNLVDEIEIIEHYLLEEAGLTAFIRFRQAIIAQFPPAQCLMLLKQYLAKHLPPYMIPAKLLVVDSIPKNTTGKTDVTSLSKLDNGSHKFPADAMQEKVRQLFAKITKNNQVGLEDSFFEIGGNSLLAINLLNEINEVFNTKLNIMDIYQYPTISSMATYVHVTNKANKGVNADVVFLRKIGAKTCLICIPPAAALPNFYKTFADKLFTDVDVISFTPPGMETPSSVAADIHLIAKHYLSLLIESSYEEYICLGFSFGGYVALEMVNQAQGSKIPIKLMILTDVPYDYNKNIQVDVNNINFERFLFTNLARSSSVHIDDLMALPYYQRFEQLGIGVKVRDNITRVYQQNEAALRHYTIPNSIVTPMVLVKCLQTSEDALFLPALSDPYAGWCSSQYNMVETITMLARHEDLFNQQHVVNLAGKISECLNKIVDSKGTKIGIKEIYPPMTSF